MRGATPPPPLARVLYVSALLIATCGLVYELCAGALATYLLGNSVTQFSLVIGTYLSAMGVGSYLSKFVDRDLLVRFVEIEIAVALIGGSKRRSCSRCSPTVRRSGWSCTRSWP